MRNCIIGTAGHVDHGKTCLIKALTGTDTDRLAEEKRRGITIENGFASLPNERGLRIGIIDVPGHERFIRNMLAGIGGIDLVLLIIALDEGVMPQTREHFNILKMLGIRRGIIVFTKKDLADAELSRMAQEETDELVRGSFLEKAPRISVSALTGENIPELKNLILDAVRETAVRREDPDAFFLPVDRVFTLKGIGTVVSGTQTEGSLAAGDELMLYPEERLVRVRSIQSYGEQETEAPAGQRTALNLADIGKEEINRGDVLARPGKLLPSLMLDAKVRLFPDTARTLKNNSRVHLSFGAAGTSCKAVLLDRDEISAGEEAYVQFRFEKPVAVRKGDRFIVLFYSPVESFGGGEFLEVDAKKHRRNQEAVIHSLSLRESGSEEEKAEEELREYSDRIPSVKELSVRLNLTEERTRSLLLELKESKRAIQIGTDRFIHMDFWKVIASQSEKLLQKFHEENSVIRQMDRAEFFNRLSSRFAIRKNQQELILSELTKRKILQISNGGVMLYGIDTTPDAEIARIAEGLLEVYRRAGFEVPYTEKLAAGYRNPRQIRQILSDLAKRGRLVRVDATAYMAPEHWEHVLDVLYRKLDRDGQITLAEYRDLLHTSRKYSQMLLESFDRRKYTKMDGEVHVKLKERGQTDAGPVRTEN